MLASELIPLYTYFHRCYEPPVLLEASILRFPVVGVHLPIKVLFTPGIAVIMLTAIWSSDDYR